MGGATGNSRVWAGRERIFLGSSGRTGNCPGWCGRDWGAGLGGCLMSGSSGVVLENSVSRPRILLAGRKVITL